MEGGCDVGESLSVAKGGRRAPRDNCMPWADTGADRWRVKRAHVGLSSRARDACCRCKTRGLRHARETVMGEWH